MLQDIRADFRARVRQSQRAGIMGWYIIITGATLMLVALFGTYGFGHPKPWIMSLVYLCFLGVAILSIRQKRRILRQFSD